MDAAACWVSHPEEWQPLLDRWQRALPGRAEYHDWPQFGGQRVRGLTVGAGEGPLPPVRLLAAVPHAHEPAPTAALVNLASLLLEGRLLDGASPRPGSPYAGLDVAAGRLLITILPDTNSQGRARSPRRAWDGELENEAFLQVAFGQAADGGRFGRYPEWSAAEHLPRVPGIEYEQLTDDLWVEPNTSRRSTHCRAMEQLFSRFRYTHHLDMHQHEGDEAALLPADFDDLPEESQREIGGWADAVLGAWEAADIRHKGSYVPYRGQPRNAFFRAFWSGLCPGMRKLTTESRNNRHAVTGERTPLERQFRSAAVALAATLRHLAAG